MTTPPPDATPPAERARAGFDPSSGDVPSAPGLFVTFTHPAADVAGFLERRPSEWLAAHAARRRGTGWIVPLLLVMGLAAPAIDLTVGFETPLFAPLLVLALALAIIVALSRGGGPGAGFTLKDRAEDCRSLLLALEGDLASGKPVAGWLDLTGPEQPAKVVRSGHSRSGVPVRLYRDEWCRLKLALRDGNGLRASAVERRKTKDPVQKRRRTKPGSSTSIHTVEIRLGVNPSLYQLRSPGTAAGTRFGSLTLARLQVADGALHAVATVEGGGLPPKDVLQLLDHLYRHLERAAAAASPSSAGTP